MAQITGPLESRKLVAMKEEATAGTDVFGGTYVAGDVQRCDYRSIRVSHDPNEIENLVTMGFLGRAPSLKGPRLARVDFRMPLRGMPGGGFYDDTPELVPEWDRVLQACAMARTFTNPGVSGSSIKYQPNATEKTYTVYVVQDVPGGNAYSRQLVGCVGTHRITGRAGEGAFLEASLVGSWEEDADITLVTGTLALTPQYPTLIGALFQIGGSNYAAKVRSFEINAGNRPGPFREINAATGVRGFKIVDRHPTFSFVCEVDREASAGFYAAFRDSTLQDCTFQLGTAALNRIKFRWGADGTTAQLQLTGLQIDAEEDVSVFRVDALGTLTAGYDEYSYLAD